MSIETELIRSQTVSTVTLDTHLKKLGFLQCNSDPCIYVAAIEELMVVGVYVDDIVTGCKSRERLEDLKKRLCSQFDMKDLGRLHHLLGLKVVQDDMKGDVWIGQSIYIERVLERYGMENAKSVGTPVDVSSKLVYADDEDEVIDSGVYKSAVGSLLYLSTGTRPDIAFAVSMVAKFSSKLTRQHWAGVKRIFRYLKGTSELWLLYKRETDSEISGYSDADWAGDLNDRKSTSGYLFKLGSAAISWKSKKQTSVALSTAEAEYMALSAATQEAMWLRRLLTELKCNTESPTTIHEDNQSAMALAQNSVFHARSKHIDIRHHFVCAKTVKLVYCCSSAMIADILTKGLTRFKFENLRKMAGVSPLIINQSEKGC